MDNYLKRIRETNQSRELEILIQKRITAAFIGAIAEFEKQWAFLWEQDEELFKKWQETRKNILDKGNNQVRIALKEIL